jgi:hypothetical protein
VSQSSLSFRSASTASEQRFYAGGAGAGLNERFLFMFGQALDLLFRFQSPPFFPDLLFKNQFQGTAPAKVFCAPVGQMIGNSAFNIGGNPRIQTPIAAS